MKYLRKFNEEMQDYVNKPDFYKLYLKSVKEYEEKVGHTIDDDDYPDYIMYAMEKAWELDKI